jgi:hypothetical protein
VVDEGLHADDHAVRDADGKSYGYCPASGVNTLFRHGAVVKYIPDSVNRRPHEVRGSAASNACFNAP